VKFTNSYIEDIPFDAGSFDAVISNGVINLVFDKQAVFDEAYRLLRPGGRLAISDIVTLERLPESVTCDAKLWAACIGGAMHREDYLQAIKAAGFRIREVTMNDYHFKAGRAQNAARRYDVTSLSLLAEK
jgi:SAM-dependent methyltransferase